MTVPTTIDHWIGPEAARGAPIPDVDLRTGGRYTITGARIKNRPDIVFTVTGTVTKLTNAAQRAEIKTDHGVKAEVWKQTILTVVEHAREEEAA